MQNVISKLKSTTRASQALQGNQLLAVQLIYWSLAIAAIVIFVLALPAYFSQIQMVSDSPLADSFQTATADAAGLAEWGISVQTYAAFLLGIAIIRAVPFVLIAFLIYFRKPNDRMTIITSLTLIILGLNADPTKPIITALLAVDSSWYFPVNFIYAVTGFMVALFFSSFPTGTFVPRWLAWVTALWALIVFQIIIPNNPLNIQTWSLPILLLIENVFFGSMFYGIYRRYQTHLNETQRQQSKWVIYGFAFVIVANLIFPFLILAIFPQSSQFGLAHALSILANRFVFLLGLLFLLLTLTFSILRYRLWEIDVLINRSILYGLITAVLVGIFVLSIFIIQQIFQLITGVMFSSVALILAALISGSLLQPLQKKLRYLVNRHLYHFVVDPDELKKQRKPTTGQLSPLANQSLGQYQLMDAIGHGGMGEVYRALQPSLNRSVAVKVLARHLHDTDEFRTRFEREARAAASLKHPHIVQIYDLDYANDTAFMVMEYIEGQNLSDLIKETGALPLDMALKLIDEIAQALDFTHTKGFVHRDIKPANIMLRASGEAVLMDFGIARLLNADAQTRVTGSGLLGTLDYAAPEQIAEAHEVDHRADIYALGVMTFQMLSGKLPFESNSASQVLFAHLYKPVPDIRNLRPELSEDISDAIIRAMAKRPEDRFKSASDFADALMMSLSEQEFYAESA